MSEHKPWSRRWREDHEQSVLSPDDSEATFTYWWEDMRPREVSRLVREVYEEGYVHGVRDGIAVAEKERDEARAELEER